MKVEEFNYYLPKEYIAQKPVSPRDHSRLMIVDRKNRKINHHYFYEIGKFFKKGDVLVLNNSKVIPARLIGKKLTTGSKVEILLLRPKIKKLDNYRWRKNWIIIGRPGLKEGEIIIFDKNLQAKVKKAVNYEREIEFNYSGERLRNIIYQIGQAPTPPYIKRLSNLKEYQTVYAKCLGSVAAPTAGFHFTPRLIKKLKTKGVIFKYITLHVGLGTFQPLKAMEVEQHRMHPEWAAIDKKTADFLNRAKKNQQRIIAVGTTTTRALEEFADKKNHLRAGRKFVDIFIYPGYEFKFVDALITNFHLPKSTLLMLVSAFTKKDLIFKAYQEAIKNNYRFFSFGDAMFII